MSLKRLSENVSKVNVGKKCKRDIYVIKRNLRFVIPYYHEWKTYAKERWFGRTLLDIYTNEFSRATANTNVKEAIDEGRIRINNQIVQSNYLIKNNDLITYTTHRHETPVKGTSLFPFIHETKDYLVLNKPSSCPIHPCGRYRENSITNILMNENNLNNLHVLYRLDRLTSGLLILGKNKEFAQYLSFLIRERYVRKQYLCKCFGHFQSALSCNVKIQIMNHRGLCKVDMENGKESMTTFIPLKYDPSTNTTIVLCKPFTGRTHQIRIHLQFLGYPIVDDTLYNSREIWGENNGINGKYLLDDQKITENFVGIHNTEKFAEPILKDSEEAEEIEDENCFDCLHKYRDPTEQELTLHLHAIQYKFFDVKNLLGKYSHKNLDEKQRENFVKYSNNLKEKSSLFLPKTENGKMKFMKQILDCPTFILNTKIPEWAKTVQNVWKENYSFM